MVVVIITTMVMKKILILMVLITDAQITVMIIIIPYKVIMGMIAIDAGANVGNGSIGACGDDGDYGMIMIW